jgi:predicted house-cleaning noncanonical NTP pyrophosphatase (MazG superfamily)
MMAKLVRDKVPDIIRRDGREPSVKRVRGDELKGALKEKLVEEALELRGSDDVYEELADVLEVVDAIIARYGVDREKLDDVKKKKLDRAGGFEEGLVLIDE